ncbi:hypothetical protein PF005_g8535 [Phytophthora fragariae]|uniref:pectate lyase n=1 Tax=Phytophthora fragariae TaxID=53985 RepID=A0A6A3F8T3_9STRA|nr:hypothetical protein PF003_g10354 [Phytophthora fragariae]KAE8940807.1 hypothetical protein PF009_g9394 [Phytophthora fragariae]KAE9012924.1 hypothetical protein PF011_g8701 [Phytophthora fragariae]KAE9107092.1 hypothetical protein PF007_g13169 [Phytophthora fragariae]KAE9135976.1 hypothetical protein PF010_g1882 [Phytophthora fragariae]
MRDFPDIALSTHIYQPWNNPGTKANIVAKASRERRHGEHHDARDRRRIVAWHSLWLNGFNDYDASDKVVQHNVYSTVTLNGLYAEEFSELYRPYSDIPRITAVETVVSAARW